MTDRIFITAQPEAVAVAVNEIQKRDPLARLIPPRPDPDTFTMNLPAGYGAFLDASRAAPLIFARHLFPVQVAAALIDAALPAQLAALPRDEAATVSVQMRASRQTAPKHYAHALQLVRETEQALAERGASLDDKNPAWAVSLFAHEDMVYGGVSACADNLSAWNGGAHRFKKDAAFISRAAFKLLEALDFFGVWPPAADQNAAPTTTAASALDLGAAPGGWTQVLLARGMHVTAVDPAALDSSLLAAATGRLTHFKGAAQHFRTTPASFDLLVNDMRMDVHASCRIMLDAAPYLKPGGVALMTLKLPQGHWYKTTAQALAILRKGYAIRGARQLFHNRSEVTVCLDAL